MKTWNKLFIGIFIIVVLSLLSCASTSKNTSKQTKPQNEEDLKNAIKARPRSAKAHYDLGYFYCFNDLKNRRSVLAAKEWEKTLGLDPNFRVKVEFKLTPQAASAFGIKTSYDITFSDFSLNFLIAQELRETAISSSTNPEIAVVDKNDKQTTLEKALALYRKGYDIDVIGRKNVEMKQIYLGSIAYTLDKIGRTAEANSTYTELAKIASVTETIAKRIGQPYDIQGDFTFTKSKYAEVTITGYKGTIKDLVIPDTLYGDKVCFIGDRAFTSKGLTSITLPDISRIGENAFANNPLTRVTINPRNDNILINKGAFGNFTEIIVLNGFKKGTYTKQGNDWLCNGYILPKPAQLVLGSGIYVVSIDDKIIRPEKDAWGNAWYLESNLYKIDNNKWSIMSGFHKIVVGYRSYEESGNNIITTSSDGTVTFTHAMVLESGVYDLTGEPQGDQILFRFRKR